MNGPVVVDSSALVAALTDSGPGGTWAASALGQGQLSAPHLMMFEATTTLRRLEIAGVIDAADTAAAFDDMNRIRLDLWPFAPLSERVWQLRSSVTSYDAAYVALAELLGAPLVTLDQRLARANGPRCKVLIPD